MTNYIGLMSGTSLDGVEAPGRSVIKWPSALRPAQVFRRRVRSELLGSTPLSRRAAPFSATHAAVVVGRIVKARLERAAPPPRSSRDGAHVQTCAKPGRVRRHRYTVHSIAGAAAAHTASSRGASLRDIAARYGAPLVPAFHRGSSAPGATVAVLNLGGIANLTVLHRDGRTIGFDCGPANVLMDLWMHRHSGAPFDADGAWAASGTVVPSLLASMWADPYFTRSPPKSTGRDLFDAPGGTYLRAAHSSLVAGVSHARGATTQACAKPYPQRRSARSADCGGRRATSDLMSHREASASSLGSIEDSAGLRRTGRGLCIRLLARASSNEALNLPE